MQLNNSDVRLVDTTDGQSKKYHCDYNYPAEIWVWVGDDWRMGMLGQGVWGPDVPQWGPGAKLGTNDITGEKTHDLQVEASDKLL
jgi:hypothetical protein